MKKFFVFVSIAASIFSACKKESLTTGTQARSIDSVPNSAAYVYRSTESVNDESYNWNPCTGEWIHFTGEALITTRYVINGNNINGEYHYNPQGEKGEGLNSGTQYQGTGSINEIFKGSFTNGLYVYTHQSRFNLVSPGKASNFVYTYNFDLHLTINANGSISVEKSGGLFACQ